jgi:hypothetical protein
MARRDEKTRRPTFLTIRQQGEIERSHGKIAAAKMARERAGNPRDFNDKLLLGINTNMIRLIP